MVSKNGNLYSQQQVICLSVCQRLKVSKLGDELRLFAWGLGWPTQKGTFTPQAVVWSSRHA